MVFMPRPIRVNVRYKVNAMHSGSAHPLIIIYKHDVVTITYINNCIRIIVYQDGNQQICIHLKCQKLFYDY